MDPRRASEVETILEKGGRFGFRSASHETMNRFEVDGAIDVPVGRRRVRVGIASLPGRGKELYLGRTRDDGKGSRRLVLEQLRGMAQEVDLLDEQGLDGQG
jgi:hypothetical protein